MDDVIDSDGFRANVGIVLMRGDGGVFLGRRVGGRGWQFPQGGVRAGEALEAAVLRELHEEIGLQGAQIEIAGCAIGCRSAMCAATARRCASARNSAGFS
jgi:putative (di)nucleoside polyphosphate hydrolase